jgi:hypothetical protein
MNKWEEAGDRLMVAPRKARMRAAETRAEKKRQKELAERDYLFRDWQEWHKKRKGELLAGAWCEAAQELSNFLETMTVEDAPALVALVERGPWREADHDTRFLVLELISHSIIYLREKVGLAPFDDPLPFSDDEPNAFLVIRGMLRDDTHTVLSGLHPE